MTKQDNKNTAHTHSVTKREKEQSREIRTFIDREPSSLLRHGTTAIAIAIIFAAAAAIVTTLPYPHSGGRTLWQVILTAVVTRL